MRTPRLMLIGVVAAMMLALPAFGVARSQSAKDRAHAGTKRHHKNPLADRNRDRIPDRWERKFHLSLRVNQANRDQDRDHMRNLMEFRTGTNPRDDDSDDDGMKDEDENAGKIISFENGVLTIGLIGDRTLDGLVNDQTEIACKQAAQPPTPPADQQPAGTSSARHDDDGDDEAGDDGGDHSGPGSPTSGPGDGDHGDDDHGDDHHGDGDHGDGDDDDEVPCTTAELVPGTFVHEAEVKVTSDGVVFSEIELMTTVAPAPAGQTQSLSR